MKVGAVLSLTLFFCGLAVNFSVVDSATDYCDADLCRKSKHIACKNKGDLAKRCSEDAKLMTISKDLKKYIVESHNRIRNQVAKGGFHGLKAAARMATMKWNSELAKFAALNVKQCKVKHDGCRNTEAFKYVGQNIAYTGWSGKTISVKAVVERQINAWYSEYNVTSRADIDNNQRPKSGAVIGHFTQMIQEKATDFGCAILKQKKRGLTEQYMACNYAFANILDVPVYKTAKKAASKCKTGVNPEYKYLCSTKEKYEMNSAQ